MFWFMSGIADEAMNRTAGMWRCFTHFLSLLRHVLEHENALGQIKPVS